MRGADEPGSGSPERPLILLHHARVPRRIPPPVERAWIRALAEEQAMRMRSLRNPEDRTASLLGLALLLDCAQGAAIEPPSLASLEWSARGRPEWPGGPEFSISHAAGHCACALAPAGLAVGLDLEACEAVTARDLRLVADEQELELQSACGLSPAEVWVTKEAVAKARGTGIAEVARVWAGPAEATVGQQRYLIARPSIAPGIAAAVATPEPCELLVRERDGAALLAAGR